jgi:transmembrane sensor
MRTKASNQSVNAQVADEAARWFVEFRLGDLDGQSREQFIAWLRASPLHIRAYLEVARTYTDMGPQSPALNPAVLDIPKLIEEARAEPDVIALRGTALPGDPSQASLKRPHSSRTKLWALAASLLLIAVSAYVKYDWTGETYSTGMGEQRSLTLADGSRVDLNARSSIHIQLGETRREIELLRGQAIFYVAKDLRRPFVVSAAATQIRAIGTSFDVNRGSGGTIVTVLEGRVAVSSTEISAPVGTSSPTPPAAGPATDVMLSAGQQIKVSAKARPRPQQVNLTVATAWTRHKLVFEGTALQDVVEQFNRYNARQMVIDDNKLLSLQVSGYYATPDPASLLNFLRTEPDIEIIESANVIHIRLK